MLKIGILVSGGGTNLQAIIDKINEGYLNAEIAVVVSNNADAYALKRAEDNNIKTFCFTNKQFLDCVYIDEIISCFLKCGVGLIVTAGFLLVLQSKFIKAFENKIINVHPSLIPSFCGKGFYGLGVHEAVLEKGVKVTGATVHFVDEGTDTGAIILQKAVDVKEDDTPEKLQKRVMEEAEWVILPQAIKLFSENKLQIYNNKVVIKN